ncbi:MAG: HdeD family acid-resistance protein [Candidatus Bipolaricaulis sp.]|nr:HdeD family acid-resistance protein [Candidatus Bipolaricaulis sp.]MDD5219667.1 HdeD family acid-resistance protein [Candidatus Bipolaricaulis sp.]MDD5646952.1 HdeD family acid-resistance protein [Candidatus Bipolaricaulis sp.]
MGTGKDLVSVLGRSWWTFLLRGLVAIAFGILAWVCPEISLRILVRLFGAYVLADGAFGVCAAALGRKEHAAGGALLLWGLLGVGVGILTFFTPGVTSLALLFYIAVWAVSTGVLEIMTALRLRKEIRGEFLLLLCGLLSVALGVALMAQPATGALALLWLIGSFVAAVGILLVILSFEVRAFRRARSQSPGARP